MSSAITTPSVTVSKSASARIDQVLDRVRGSLWGILIGDALAMPAHWYYDIHLLRKTFGKIESYLPAPIHLKGSILNLSNTK
jgi:ADP-ribosyl-[dinitrogen reductase] hydrolase